MNKNDILTTEELFDEFNRLGIEAKAALSANLNVYNAIQLMNVPGDYDKLLGAIDYHINSWKSTKSALRELNRNVVTKRCKKMEERAKAFIAPQDAFVVTDVKASDFARMVNVVAGITMRTVEDCSRIVYDILIRLSLLKSHQINMDSIDEDIINSVNVLKLNDIDLTEIPCKLFAKLYDKKDTFSSLNLRAISMSIAGPRNSEYSRILTGNWEKCSNPISLGEVVKSAYSLKETTEAMDRYFAEIKDKFQKKGMDIFGDVVYYNSRV